MPNNSAIGLKISLLTVLLILIYLFRHLLVAAPAVDPNHEFDTKRAFERLERILGDQAPHSVDTAANDKVIARLKSEITDLGFTPFAQDEFHCVSTRRSARCARLQNILFWVTEPGPNAVLVLSHHDSVPAGPGASDDGAGVAASLEIASLMKSRNLDRPMLILITDGEELGLMGANLFVEKHPLASSVGAVVNMEARGVSGLSAFFQTSRPNGRDLEALHSDTRLPAASSLNADIYELLPNDTDLTEFLGLPIDAVNYAYSGDVAFYHTPGDTLANMDKRALFNLGASGLAAVETFLGQSGDEPEGQLLYVDILGLFIIQASTAIGLIIISLAGVLTLAAFWSTRATSPILKALALPPLAIALSLAFAIGATMLIASIRPEAGFASAHPIALRGLHICAALFGALIAYLALAGRQTKDAMFASAWLWTAIIALTAFFLVQGAAIIFVPALTLFALAAIASLFDKNSISSLFAVLGIFAFAVIALPLTALGEVSLIIEHAAPFVFAPILLFIFAAPLLTNKTGAQGKHFKAPLMIAGAAALIFGVSSLFVPPYSEHAPRPMSVTHLQSTQEKEAVWNVTGSDRVPSEMNAVSPFEPGAYSIFNAPRQLAAAPLIDGNVDAFITDDTVSDGTRSITLRLEGTNTDRLTALFQIENSLSSLRINGFTIDSPASIGNVICAGRACQTVNVYIEFPETDTPPMFDILSTRFGLGPEGQPLQKARPDWTISRQTGDARLQHIRISP